MKMSSKDIGIIGLARKFFRFFSSKIYIFYKISMTPFDRTKFQNLFYKLLWFLMELWAI